jgi:hypothetical protein
MAMVATIDICSHWASNWEVEGSHDNTYLVQFHRQEPASCSCLAYRYSGDYGSQHCKHIELVREHGCFYHPDTSDFGNNNWEAQEGIKLMSTAGDDAGARCPGCAAPMILERVFA